jgi:hypothetical protein
MPTRIVPGSGAIIKPYFNSIYSVTEIEVIDGGSGYASTDPPKITIEGTSAPTVEGSFYPVISSTGKIARIVVLNGGSGYTPLESYAGNGPDTRIGIETTFYLDSSVIVQKTSGSGVPYYSVSSPESNIIMGIGAGIGSAIYENGYNVAISTSISGVSSAITPDFSDNQNRFYGFPTGYEQKSTTGVGTGAKFSAFIVYNSSTGNAISTSLVLVDGGRGYGVGDTVSISGTHFGGSSPTNDLSFKVSKVANTIVVSAANSTFNNIPGTTIVGLGSGATFNVSRGVTGSISSIQLVNGGTGYALTDVISIAGTYVGGSTPADNILVSPTVLGSNKLPSKLYIDKLNDNSFKVSGLATSPALNLISYGTGNHSFTLDNPNPNVIIQIDNIIQTPVYYRNSNISLSKEIGLYDNTIYLSSGISSITTLDIFNIDSEYLKVTSVGIGSTNAIGVSRGFFGSIQDYHSVGSAVTLVRGDFNIINDTIYFSTPPYGPTGPEGLKTRSSFQGRAFSRRFDPELVNDKNFTIDDISNQFTGIAASEFVLKSKFNNVVGLFTDTNSVLNSTADINNNPVILINNVPQVSGVDFNIDTPGQNTIKFLTEAPKAGQIVRVAITTGYGYQPLVAAGATIVVGKGISESSYTSTFYSITQDTSSTGMFFKPDGTKLFVVGDLNNRIYEYSLSTPYDLTTVGFGTSCPTTGETSPTGIFFKPDGTQVFYTGASSNNISRATLLTPWSLVGASSTTVVVPAATITAITGSAETSPQGIFIRPDGEKVYLLGSGLDIIYQLTLTTGWDFNTINTGLSTSFSLSSVETTPTGIRFSPDGYRVYICGQSSVANASLGVTSGQDRVHVFRLTIPWDISTAVYDNQTFLISPQDATPTDIEFNSGRTKMYILGDTNNRIYEYNLIERGAISSISIRGAGSGYRTPPAISLISNSGSGASFESSIGVGGTVTSLSVVNSGFGYTSDPLPRVVVDSPAGYSDLPLIYTGGTSGIGQGAKASVSVGFGSSITQFELEEPGIAYKVGDVLTVSGIVTDPSVGVGFSEFRITVLETMTDKFGGFYPGQFVKFDDISPLFNGTKTKFTLTVTQGGVTDILSLKTDTSTDLKIENNLFVYINDVLQEPLVAYTFSGSRLTFKEPPKPNSKCYILFYRGSDLDVEQIDPPKTIKEGDIVQIVENILDPFDRSQFDRVVKRIISSNSLDTFTYDSLGINIDPLKERPLKWRKQTSDAIINGVLYSKSRPDLKARITPTTKIIKNVGISDDTIYVNNAFPLFTAVDQITEELKDIEIVENREILPALASAVVSTATTISEINIDFPGVGYALTNSPSVAISSSRIIKKDPIYNWKSSVGISTNYNFNSIVYGNSLVSVGSSGLVGISTNGINWDTSNIGYGGTVSFNHITFASTNKYIAVGSTAIAVYATGVGSTLSSWSQYTLYKETFIIGNPNPLITLSPFVGELYGSSYSNLRDTLVIVGSDSTIFTAVGITTTGLLQKIPPSFANLNSITNNESIFVSVGDDGTIVYSDFGNIWTRIANLGTSENLKCIIWDKTKFVVCGNNGTILTSSSGFDSWNIISTDVSVDFEKIVYYDGFYVSLTSLGELYYSFNLSNWVSRSTLQSNALKDLIFINSFGDNGRYIAVGSAGTAIYAEPIYNRATATSSVSNGIVTSITITNGGFGYSQQVPPPVIIDYDTTKSEKVFSIKSEGDYGIIKSIGVGASTINFTLESEKYDNSTLGLGYSSLNNYGVQYSNLKVGDYFVIYDSNVIAGHALTGISTYLGGLGNYPNSRVGTAVSFIDGLYRVERVTSPVAGIITVGCNFTFSPSGGAIQISAFENPKGYIGKYTWGKIYGFQNRSRESPSSFEVNTNNGLVGLSTAPDVYRTRGVV